MHKITFSLIFLTSFLFCTSLEGQNWRLFFEKTQIDKFRSANEALGPPAEGEHRVVFMGNSITEFWPKMRPRFFQNRGYIGRGISGQTTSQMLLRFRTDVISLQPSVMVVLAGINDIAENAGPIPLEIVAENIMTMSELARYHGIEVIICSVIPAIDFPWNSGMEPAGKVLKLNKLLQEYAKEKDFLYVDYHTAMKDEKNGLKVPDYTSASDLVHPNEAGYMVMESLVQPEIEMILTRLRFPNKVVGFKVRKCKFKKKKVVVEFDEAESGLVYKGSFLDGFEIAGADKKFELAEAKIKGEKVVVWSSKVKRPKYIRYSWSDEVWGNLYDGEGKPAASFDIGKEEL